MTFAKQLTLLRKRQNLSIRGLARKSGLSPIYISEIERGLSKNMSYAKILMLEKALDLNGELLICSSFAGRAFINRIRCSPEYVKIFRAMLKKVFKDKAELVWESLNSESL